MVGAALQRHQEVPLIRLHRDDLSVLLAFVESPDLRLGGDRGKFLRLGGPSGRGDIAGGPGEAGGGAIPAGGETQRQEDRQSQGEKLLHGGALPFCRWGRFLGGTPPFRPQHSRPKDGNPYKPAKRSDKAVSIQQKFRINPRPKAPPSAKKAPRQDGGALLRFGFALRLPSWDAPRPKAPRRRASRRRRRPCTSRRGARRSPGPPGRWSGPRPA